MQDFYLVGYSKSLLDSWSVATKGATSPSTLPTLWPGRWNGATPPHLVFFPGSFGSQFCSPWGLTPGHLIEETLPWLIGGRKLGGKFLNSKRRGSIRWSFLVHGFFGNIGTRVSLRGLPQICSVLYRSLRTSAICGCLQGQRGLLP